MRFWLPFAFLLAATALSVLLLEPLGTEVCVGIFCVGVLAFVASLVFAARAEPTEPAPVVHFAVSKRAETPVDSLIGANGDPSLCRLRAAPRAQIAWGFNGLQLAEPRLLEALARGMGLAGVSDADRARLARTVDWLSAKSDADLTFEMTADHRDPTDEIEISASELTDLVSTGQAAIDVRYVVERAHLPDDVVGEDVPRAASGR